MKIKKQDIEKKYGSVFLMQAMRKINNLRKQNNKPLIIINNCPSHHTDDFTKHGYTGKRRSKGFHDKNEIPLTRKRLLELGYSITENVSERNSESIKLNQDHINYMNKYKTRLFHMGLK